VLERQMFLGFYLKEPLLRTFIILKQQQLLLKLQTTSDVLEDRVTPDNWRLSLASQIMTASIAKCHLPPFCNKDKI